MILDTVGGATFGQAIEHLAPRGIVVNIATQSPEETVTFRARAFRPVARREHLYPEPVRRDESARQRNR